MAKVLLQVRKLCAFDLALMKIARTVFWNVCAVRLSMEAEPPDSAHEWVREAKEYLRTIVWWRW
jgi:hypothetical protein